MPREYNEEEWSMSSEERLAEFMPRNNSRQGGVKTGPDIFAGNRRMPIPQPKKRRPLPLHHLSVFPRSIYHRTLLRFPKQQRLLILHMLGLSTEDTCHMVRVPYVKAHQCVLYMRERIKECGKNELSKKIRNHLYATGYVQEYNPAFKRSSKERLQ